MMSGGTTYAAKSEPGEQDYETSEQDQKMLDKAEERRSRRCLLEGESSMPRRV